MNGNLEVLEVLNEYGHSLSVRNIAQWTPLHYALKYGHTKVIDFLVGIHAYEIQSKQGVLFIFILFH